MSRKHFLANRNRMEDVALVFINLALACAIDATTKISVHRLIPMEFRL